MASVDEDDCCWAIVIGVDGRAGVWELILGAVGSDVVMWIGVCRMMESNGPSTIVDGKDGVLGFSSTDSKVCWRNCNGDRSRDARVRSGLGFGPGSDRTGPGVRSSSGSGSALGLGVQFRVRSGLGVL